MIENWLSSRFSQMHGIGAKLITDGLSEAGHDIATACNLYTQSSNIMLHQKNFYQNFLYQIDYNKFQFSS